MKVLIRTILCLFLSGTFLLTGLCKMVPHLHPDTYHFLNVLFQSEITPIWQEKVFDQLGVKMHPVVFKFIVGNLEAFSAIIIWAGNNVRKLAAVFLSIIMVNACLTHYWLNQDFTFPLVLLCCSVVVFVLSSDDTPMVKADKSSKKKS